VIDRSLVCRIQAMMPMQQAATYHHRDGGDSYTDYPLAAVRPRRVTTKDAAIAPELLLKTEKVFELYKNVLDAANCPDPTKDSYLTDAAGHAWTVIEVAGQFGDTVFNCYCRRRVE
jgi:hypothetical protein